MAKRILVGLALLLVALTAVVLVRTIQLSHDMPDIGPVAQHDFDEDAVVERMSEALQFPTVSFDDRADMDVDAFEGWISFVEASYPTMHATLERERIGDFTLLYRWEGENPDL
mgnify:CR=1 FL=1